MQKREKLGQQPASTEATTAVDDVDVLVQNPILQPEEVTVPPETPKFTDNIKLDEAEAPDEEAEEPM